MSAKENVNKAVTTACIMIVQRNFWGKQVINENL